MAEPAVAVVRLETLTCGGCGIAFAVPESLHRQYMESGTSVRCPNVKCPWTGMVRSVSDVQRLKTELEAEKKRTERAIQGRRWAEEETERARRSRSAARGQVTKLKNRAAAGLCPCCRSSFPDLRNHMATEHPGFAGEEVEPS